MANNFPSAPPFGLFPQLKFKSNIDSNIRRHVQQPPRIPPTVQPIMNSAEEDSDMDEGEICDDDEEMSATDNIQALPNVQPPPPDPQSANGLKFGNHASINSNNAQASVTHSISDSNPQDTCRVTKSVTEMRRKAQAAVMYLACSLKLSFEEIVGEGIDEEVLRTVFRQLRLPVPSPDTSSLQTIKLVGKHEDSGLSETAPADGAGQSDQLDPGPNPREKSPQADNQGPQGALYQSGANLTTVPSSIDAKAYVASGNEEGDNLRISDEAEMLSKLRQNSPRLSSNPTPADARIQSLGERPTEQASNGEQGALSSTTENGVQSSAQPPVDSVSTKPQETRETESRNRKRPVATDFDSGPIAWTNIAKHRKFGDRLAARDARLVIDVSDDEGDYEAPGATKYDNAAESPQPSFRASAQPNKTGLAATGTNSTLTQAIKDQEKKIEDLNKMIEQRSKRQKNVSSAANTPPVSLSKPATPIPRLVSEATSRIIPLTSGQGDLALSEPGGSSQPRESPLPKLERDSPAKLSPDNTGVVPELGDSSNGSRNDASDPSYNKVFISSSNNLTSTDQVVSPEITLPLPDPDHIPEEPEDAGDDSGKIRRNSMESSSGSDMDVSVQDLIPPEGEETGQLGSPTDPSLAVINTAESEAPGQHPASRSTSNEIKEAIASGNSKDPVAEVVAADVFEATTNNNSISDDVNSNAVLSRMDKSPDAMDFSPEEIFDDDNRLALGSEANDLPFHQKEHLRDENSQTAPIQPESDTAHGNHSLFYSSPLTVFKSFRYHPDFLKLVPGGFRSLTYSHVIDPNKPLCPYETQGGSCNDELCIWQHFRQIIMPDDRILLELATTEGSTEEMQAQFKQGLHSEILHLTQIGVRDFETVAKKIVEFRRRSLGDPTRVLRNI